MPSDFPQIAPFETLAAMVSPLALILLDIRLPEDVAEDPTALPGAHAIAFDDIEEQVRLAEPAGAIVICHKGLKLSAGVTARLCARGLAAWRLQGGHVGWTEAGLPTTKATPPRLVAMPLNATPTASLATWAMVRFTAPRAELLEVPPADVPGVVDRFGAVVANTLPDLPTIARMDDALPALALALHEGPPSQSFAMLDQVYKGAVRRLIDSREVAA